MIPMRIFALCAIFALLPTACSDDDGATGITPCSDAQIAGITQTDAAGRIIGEPDPSDWNCPAENSLICTGAAAPNPAITRTTIRFQLGEKAVVSIVLKSDCRTVARIVAVEEYEAGDYQYQLDLSGLTTGLYRCEVRAESQTRSNLIHGDISVVR